MPAMPIYDFTVTVETQHVPNRPEAEDGSYGFVYTITIENTGDVPAQLISRHWLITHADGLVEEVKGLGVVGHQPLLRPGESFEYTSGCRLRTSTGQMEGSYFCVAEDGHRFEVPIAPFRLNADDLSAPMASVPRSPRVLH